MKPFGQGAGDELTERAALCQELEQLLGRWRRLAARSSQPSSVEPVLIPDLLLLSPSGNGNSSLFQSMAEYLDNEGLLFFEGDEMVVEFYMDYCQKDEPFTEMTRFVETIRCAAGRQNAFRGMVCVNITEWLLHLDEKYFSVLMEYLAQHGDPWLIVLHVEKADKEAFAQLEAKAAGYLRLETLRIAPPRPRVLLDIVTENLSRYGFSLAPDARQLLQSTILALRKAPAFDGYKTLLRLSQDIAYSALTAQVFPGNTLSADHLLGFERCGVYLQRLKRREQKRKIGFGEGTEDDA